MAVYINKLNGGDIIIGTSGGSSDTGDGWIFTTDTSYTNIEVTNLHYGENEGVWFGNITDTGTGEQQNDIFFDYGGGNPDATRLEANGLSFKNFNSVYANR